MNSAIASANTALINGTLKQVYTLLSLNMVSSAIAASVCMQIRISFLTSLLMTVGALILLFVINKKAYKSSGVWLTFAFTGLLGGSLGSTLNHFMGLSNGGAIITQALATTAIIFIALSAYTIRRPNKDFSFMGGFLLAGLIVAILAAIANIFLAIPALSVTISSAVALLMCGFIIYDTNRIVRHESNYVLATVSLYLSIFNLFTSLLNILGFLDKE